MNIWNMRVYTVRHKRWNGEIEYWNFFLDCWVTTKEFCLDCTTNDWIAAENFVKDNGGEVVKLRVRVR